MLWQALYTTHYGQELSNSKNQKKIGQAKFAHFHRGGAILGWVILHQIRVSEQILLRKNGISCLWGERAHPSPMDLEGRKFIIFQKKKFEKNFTILGQDPRIFGHVEISTMT